MSYDNLLHSFHMKPIWVATFSSSLILEDCLLCLDRRVEHFLVEKTKLKSSHLKMEGNYLTSFLTLHPFLLVIEQFIPSENLVAKLIYDCDIFCMSMEGCYTVLYEHRNQLKLIEKLLLATAKLAKKQS